MERLPPAPKTVVAGAQPVRFEGRHMFGRKREDEPERWYLLPAMQHGARRKFYWRLAAALIVGSLAATAVSVWIYFANRL